MAGEVGGLGELGFGKNQAIKKALLRNSADSEAI